MHTCRGLLIDRSRSFRLVRRFVLYPLITVVVLAAAAIAYYFATLYTPERPQEGFLALTGATVLTGPDLDPLRGATVLVRDGIVIEVGGADDVDVPAGATTLDLRGTTLMPGLVDLHVHLASPARERGEEVGIVQMPRLVLDVARYVPATRRAFLEHGVTSVRSLGDEHQWVTELRRMSADGELEGPRVFAAGPLFTTARGHPVVTFGVDPQSDGVRLASTADGARRAVRALASGEGRVDVIKIVQESGSRDFPMEPIAPDVLRALVGEAHAHGLAVTAHWGTLEDLDDVLAAGVDELQHLESRGVLDGWPAATLDSLLEQDVPIAPTLAVTQVAIPPQVHQQLRHRVAELHAAGGRVVAGSDAGMPGVAFGAGLQRELELLVDSGLTPREALRAATSEAAHVLGADDIGAIEPGRAADLVVVDGDPLDRIEAIRDVVMVLRDGRVVVDRRD